jgi:hypothetical protein
LKNKQIAVLEKELVKFRLYQKQAPHLNRWHDVDDYLKYDKIKLKILLH